MLVKIYDVVGGFYRYRGVKYTMYKAKTDNNENWKYFWKEDLTT